MRSAGAFVHSRFEVEVIGWLPPMRSLFALLACLVGCGSPTPLKMTKYSGTRGPWCAPNKRVQIGQRVVGTVGMGENKWKNFLVDDGGREYDPEKLADQAWSYLERTGDADYVMRGYHKEGRQTRMTVVAINPVVVVLETRPLPAGADRTIASPERSFWVAQISSERSHPDYRDGMKWFSPDLKQPPTILAFSQDNVATIPLANGKLNLVRSGDECKTTRE